MSFAGTWKAEINTPIGAQRATAKISLEGEKLTGVLDSAQGPMAIEGNVAGNSATWTGKATSPMPMTLTFEVTLSGDSFSGHVKAGLFGKFGIKAERIPSAPLER